MESQRAQSLIEVIVSVAVASVVLGAVLGAIAVTSRHFAPDARRTAVDRALTRELRVAADVLKYQGSAVKDASVATAVPMPTGTPLAVTMSVTTSAAPGGGVNVSISADAADGSISETVRAAVGSRAPLPGSTMSAGTGAAPVSVPNH